MVAISHDYKFIFLKPQKTAGTSVEMYLEPYCRPPGAEIHHYGPGNYSSHGIVAPRGAQYLRPAVWTMRGKVQWRPHMTAIKVRRAIGRRRWNRYRRIATVRNPYDKMVSQFHWTLDVRAKRRDFSKIKSKFRDYVLSETWPNDCRIVHIKEKYILTHTIRFESIVSDLSELCERLKIPSGKGDLSHMKNRSKLRADVSISDYFDAETREVVLRRSQWLFEKIGYSHDPRDADAELESDLKAAQ